MTQKLPPSDDFAYGSPAYGTNVIGYLGARPDTTNFQTGRMHNGYGGASVRSENQSDATGAPAGFLRRQTFAAPQRVILVSRKKAAAGVALGAQLKQHAVLARVTGGTLAGDGTDIVRLDGLTGYAFTVEWAASVSAFRYRLKRFVAGAETILATFDDVTALGGQWTSDTRLILDVTTDGSGNVALAGSVGAAPLGLSFAPGAAMAPGAGTVIWNAGGTGINALHTVLLDNPVHGTPLGVPAVGKLPGFPNPGDVLVVSTTDSSGSKITAAGRCGFAMDGERVFSAPAASIVSLASAFEVWDMTTPASPVLTFADDWQRAAPALAEAMTDRFGTAGRNMACDYTCDQASIETAGAFLKRSLAAEEAESPATVALGKAITFDGAADYLILSNAQNTYPPPAVSSQTSITLGIWAKLSSTSAATRTLYEGIVTSPAANGAGFSLALVVAGASSHLQLTMAYPSTTTTVNSPNFDIALYAGSAFCFVATFRANSNPTTGEGRVRFYIGRLGVASLLGEVTTAAAVRPQWLSSGQHTVAANGTPAQFFPGTLDELSVFFAELTPDQVGQLCDGNADADALIPLGLAAGWHFDAFTDLGGTDGRRWAPWYAAVAGGVSAAPADWLAEKNTVTVADPGLVPVHPASSFVALSQRPADSPTDQSRQVAFRAAGATSIGGIVVRASPGASKGAYTGYRLDVAPGVPARIVLYRVLAGVPTAIAEQNPLSGTVDVAAGVAATVALSVAQQPASGPTGPVALSPAVDGALVPMVSLQPGTVLVGLDGTVIDAGQARILSGPAEGFHGFVDGLGNRFDAWAPGPVGAGADPSTFPSYPVAAEDDGAAGALEDVLTPEWELQVDYPAPVAVMNFDSGHDQRVVQEGYVRRVFHCQLRAGSDDEVSALRTFWDDHGGVEVPFAFDPSVFLAGQIAGTFRFVADSLEDGYAGNVRVTTFELQEVRQSA